jgi:GH15 family glucan-1,4-alpha-glucosidase
VARPSAGLAGNPSRSSRYPPIGDYGLIGDCHSGALVSRTGSIDWYCVPRFDGGSAFGRLLDWDGGGYCSIGPTSRRFDVSRRYLDDTMVLETNFRTGLGEARLFDCMAMRRGGSRRPHRQLIRILEGVKGRFEAEVRISPRFDYGTVRPWIRSHGDRLFSATGGNDALVICGDPDLEPVGKHDLAARIEVRAGERARLSIQYVRPESLDDDPPEPMGADEIDRRFDTTIRWWRTWSKRVAKIDPGGYGPTRSALVLKALTNAPTGAMVAALTTSLPEAPGGARNWDYRYSWIRDSVFAARALTELGCDAEADGFRRFVERSAAGGAADLRIMYGVGGERRLTELELPELEGYRGSKPVRIGNAAAGQTQLDVFGHLLELAWLWHELGHSPDDDYWTFLVDLVDHAAARWEEPDCGIWEVRGPAKHFVHSKVMCWAAISRGLLLARECHRKAPERRWRAVLKELRTVIEAKGYDGRRGVFVRSFGSREMDSSLLLIPRVGFVEYEDERMVRTVQAIRDDLDKDGFLMRYRAKDGLSRAEGAFLPCSFWLAECLARQGREEEAREVFERASSAASDLGLFTEEYDPRTKGMLGNYPQGLSHLSHIAAAVALAGSPTRRRQQT